MNSILDIIQESSPHGGFVKQSSGVWYVASDAVAKEKIGQR